MTIKRRDFLGHMAAGSAIVTMPAFLTGCGVNPATDIAAPTPDKIQQLIEDAKNIQNLADERNKLLEQIK